MPCPKITESAKFTAGCNGATVPTASTPPQSGGMAGQFDAVGLTGAAHVGDDEDAACYGFGPRFEHALALGDGHRGAFARRAADEDAVGPFGDEFVGVGLDLRKIDCARFVERREDGGNESG